MRGLFLLLFVVLSARSGRAAGGTRCVTHATSTLLIDAAPLALVLAPASAVACTLPNRRRHPAAAYAMNLHGFLLGDYPETQLKTLLRSSRSLFVKRFAAGTLIRQRLAPITATSTVRKFSAGHVLFELSRHAHFAACSINAYRRRFCAACRALAYLYLRSARSILSPYVLRNVIPSTPSKRKSIRMPRIPGEADLPLLT